MQVFTQERPWGSFRQYAEGEPVTVKTIFIRAGGSLSLQTHRKRSEFWRVLRGTPQITVGQQVVAAKPGDEFEIGIGVEHRASAPDGEAEFLEVSRGEFDENDIMRLEDKYGRVST
ncbi:MAG TPA: phosphomannose isomerase type II C-terminal cupin domain [Candidatus Paceibacterota bacterium]